MVSGEVIIIYSSHHNISRWPALCHKEATQWIYGCLQQLYNQAIIRLNSLFTKMNSNLVLYGPALLHNGRTLKVKGEFIYWRNVSLLLYWLSLMEYYHIILWYCEVVQRMLAAFVGPALYCLWEGFVYHG